MRSGWWRLVIAFLSALLPFTVAAGVGFATLHGRTAGGGGVLAAPLGDAGSPLLLGILLRNTAVALALFSGVLTVGIGSVLGIAFQGFVVGASTGAAATEVGAASALGSVVGYAVLEIPALLLAAAAGMLPAVAALLPARGVPPAAPLSRYVAAFRPALFVLGAALLLLVVGAAVETSLITSRSH